MANEAPTILCIASYFKGERFMIEAAAKGAKATCDGLRAHHSPPLPHGVVGGHGDEPAGPLALKQLLEDNQWPQAHLTLIPVLNPGGLAQNRRENEEGIDINRDYRHFRSPEARAHVSWLEAQPVWWRVDGQAGSLLPA